MRKNKPSYQIPKLPLPILYVVIFFIFLITVTVYYSYEQSRIYSSNEQMFRIQLADIKKQLDKTIKDYEDLQKVDQTVRNNELEAEIRNIQETYKAAVETYEALIKLKEQNVKTPEFDENFATALTMLSERNYSSASAVIQETNAGIKKKQAEIAASFQIPASVPVNNTAPGGGYRQQVVENEYGSYLVHVFAADLNSYRVIVDTASDGTCTNDCPVDSLASYAGRSGAVAGINGPYFCPADYPSCADKKNSFDTLLMNKNKTYFNSDNNVYSTVPAVIFSAGSARYVGQSLEWGRDTGPDSVIASQPMLVSGGNAIFGGDDEIKRAGKGTRSFIGSTGSTVYIGVVYNANVAEVAQVLKTMGVEYALNLDSGGSTAFWVNGRYVAGPGRNTPFGILIVPR